MSAFELAVAGLAVWRVARMLTVEDGPGDMLRRWRLAVGAEETIGGWWTAPTAWGRLWCCPYCLSVWLAALVYGLWLLAPVAWPVVVMLAISGVASAIQAVTTRSET